MSYDLRSLNLPRLGSRGLAVLSRLARMPLVGRSLTARLRRDAGVDRLRDVALTEPPTFLPHHAADDPGIPPLDPFDPHDSPYSDWPAEPPRPLGFRFPSVAMYEAAYREGRATPESVAAAFLSQQKASDSGARPLRAFIDVHDDDVMAQAAASAARWRAGRPLGPWDGVPVAVKDEFSVTGYPLSVGTRVLAGAPRTSDATIVARMRAAGAVIIGRANMHELGLDVTGLNPHYGVTRNPYDDRRHSGGSSSGPAAAVAAGLVPVALGADGGGSIRIPAAMCGVVGIKPTFGRVSEHGAATLVWSLAYAGPIAATVADCAAAYALVAGDDPLDANSRAHPSVAIDVAVPQSLRGLRIGVYRPWFAHAEPDIVAANTALLDEFRRAGAQIVDIVIPELDLQRVAHVAIITGEMAAATASVFAARRADFGLDVQLSLTLASAFTAPELINAARVRTRAMAHWRAALREVHVIATPATGRVAPVIDPAMVPRGGSDLSLTTDVMRFAFPANLTGHPAIAFPAGYDRSGLPIGMQIVGRPWSERLLFRVAAYAEQVLERRPPTRWHPTLAD